MNNLIFTFGFLELSDSIIVVLYNKHVFSTNEENICIF